MATIAPTTMQGPGQRLATETVLTASDTFTYLPNTGQILIIRNGTAGALNPVLDGADGTTVPVPGLGNVNVAAGYTFAIAAGAVRAIPLDTIGYYLQGVIAVTGASGATAILLNPQ